MIVGDQPRVFGDEVIAAVSSRSDGTMLDRTNADIHSPEIVRNRMEFCAADNIPYNSCVYQKIIYGADQTYDKIQLVERPNTEGVAADVLVTKTPQIGLFLPVADCVATILYDPAEHVLALAHIGRHASFAKTMTKTLQYFEQHGSVMSDIRIWMAPSVARSDYRMEYFDHMGDPDWQGFCDKKPDGIYLDLAGYNTRLAVHAGVQSDRITRSTVNTARDKNYFSHSMGDTTGRFAVVAMMR